MSNITDFIMPKLGLTMEEGVISEWLVKPGGTFKKGEPIVVIETDKIANEFEAADAGVLHKIIVEEGSVAAVGETIAHWDIGKSSTLTEQSIAVSVKSAEVEKAYTAGETKVSRSANHSEGERIFATPLARRLAKENEVELSGVEGSGPRGRIKADDIHRHIALQSESLLSTRNATATRSREEKSQNYGPKRRAATNYQLAAAKRLTEAKQETPHFYLSSEVDVEQLLEVRGRINCEDEALRISISHLIITAIGRSLVDVPEANCVWDNGEIIEFSHADVGVAVNTDGGLFVPVLRDIGHKGILGISSEATSLVERARSGKLRSSDAYGGATTVSNAGMFDVTYMSSIINPGQSSILGVGSVRQAFRPDNDGRPILRKEMGIVLSCDHRVFDGVTGLRLLNRIKHYLESPFKLIVN